MASLEDLERRVSALETRVVEEARLRAAVDRDQADLSSAIRATHHLVQALSITQSDEMERLRRVEEKIDGIAGAVTSMFAMLTELVNREGRGNGG